MGRKFRHRRQTVMAIGTLVIGGMLAAKFIAIFLIPVTYYVICALCGQARRRRDCHARC